MKSSTKIIYVAVTLLVALCISPKAIAQSNSTVKSETVAKAGDSLYPLYMLEGARIVMIRTSTYNVQITATYMGIPLNHIGIRFEPIAQPSFAEATDNNGQLNITFTPYTMIGEDIIVSAHALSTEGFFLDRVVGHIFFDTTGEIFRITNADEN